jgi:hypothetical protein
LRDRGGVRSRSVHRFLKPDLDHNARTDDLKQVPAAADKRGSVRLYDRDVSRESSIGYRHAASRNRTEAGNTGGSAPT